MVPLQAITGQRLVMDSWGRTQFVSSRPTELLLDHFQYLLLIELLRKTLNGSQSLTTIALCMDRH
jgi:hypothetical protein